VRHEPWRVTRETQSWRVKSGREWGPYTELSLRWSPKVYKANGIK